MPQHATRTTWKKGKPGGPGRPRMTEEEKRKARMQRAIDYDYKQELRAAMPLAVDEIIRRLDKRSMKDGDLVRTFGEIRDSLHGKPAQVISGPDGGPLVGTFVAMLGQIDGAKAEKLTAPIAAAAEKAQQVREAEGANGNGAHEKI